MKQIEFVCAEHVQPDPVGPKITLVHGKWAICVGHGVAGHDWRAVAPTARDEVGDVRELRRKAS